MPVMLSVAVDEALAEQIEMLSRDTGRSVEELHQVALAQFLREEREHVDAVLDGLRDADQGSVISHDEVKAWIGSLAEPSAEERVSGRSVRRAS